MENLSIDFAESIAEVTELEHQQFNFNLQNVDPKEPGDEDDEEVEGEEEDVVEDEGGSDAADNPPHDPNTVHSPVTTQPGGSPRRG